ncbi:hypothetical protein SAMN06265827_10599 [Orenia metallireducens]|uniref:Uncharacterized protein n=1 Tax=Orenia metallireducens TaxID=1413210 RepID=A0A285G6V3_9FIRM|nr:hypothetical protein SAMN06265827_10599 [Orenia metallireducens]
MTPLIIGKVALVLIVLERLYHELIKEDDKIG